ncbi:fibropellin-3-like [Anneissia japonica]|uniref:fibropellin-3-like n=1 Tax=Anneissia japonica TaxID=1529436 RepID=UPI0014254D88|nr:fibropellin-3-like [Anneissia japonica]
MNILSLVCRPYCCNLNSAHMKLLLVTALLAAPLSWQAEAQSDPPSCLVADNPCQNNAPCVGDGGNGSYICQCPQNYVGQNCEEFYLSNCGGGYYSSPDYFTSPNYPSEYPNRASCVYLVRVYGAPAITFTVHEFDTEVSMVINMARLHVGLYSLLSNAY